MSEAATKLSSVTTLAEVKAERARLAAERSARDEARTSDDEMERELQGLADDQALAKAELEIGPVGKKLAVCKTPRGSVIVKKPNHVLFRRFQDSGADSTDEFEKLVRPCVVHPSPAAFDALLEEYPAALTAIATQVCALAGAQLKQLGGK